jgi:hypothetical protein
VDQHKSDVLWDDGEPDVPAGVATAGGPVGAGFWGLDHVVGAALRSGTTLMKTGPIVPCSFQQGGLVLGCPLSVLYHKQLVLAVAATRRCRDP